MYNKLDDTNDKEVIIINIGVDIGGNHVGIGIVSPEGEILKKEIVNYSNDEVTPQIIFDAINNFLEKNDSNKIRSIGIGVPGIATGTHIDYTCNLPLSGCEIREYIKTKLPIYVSNDANCAAIAEFQVVDKKFFNHYGLVTVGTGIGAGVLLNGSLLEGATGSAAELGHMIIEKGGLKCRCGRQGCFEQYASVSALKRKTNLDSLEEVFYLCDKNEVIQKTFDEYLNDLSEGLANFINLYDLEVLVIGGSLSTYSHKYLTKLKTMILEKIYNKYTYELELKPANLGNDAGIIGASFLKEYIGNKDE